MAKAFILVDEQEKGLSSSVQGFLAGTGHRKWTAVAYDEAAAMVREAGLDPDRMHIILDARGGIELLQRLVETASDTELVVITGAPAIGSACPFRRVGEYGGPGRDDLLGTPVPTAAGAPGAQAPRDGTDSFGHDLGAILHSVPDAIITVDRNLAVVEVNSAAERLCGFSREQAVGRPIRECQRACRGACLAALQQTIATRRAIEELPIECLASREAVQVRRVTATPLLGRSGASGGVLVVRDEARRPRLDTSLQERPEFYRMVGASDRMREVFSIIRVLADVDSSVLVTGESGTGKELVAEALHAAGCRRHKPLVKVNCAALSEGLLETELFGHVRGAFTGACKDTVGRFQKAHGGTILLDEIGEMTARTQLRLLRVLESRHVEKVGDSSPIAVDVRVVAATNCDLKEKVEEGEFRRDLYYRLKVVEIHLPPLRERREDIPMLVQHVMNRLSTRFGKRNRSVSDAVTELFRYYDWPGNVRQLENTLEHAFVLCLHDTITTRDLPADFMAVSGERVPDGSPAVPHEARAIREALRRSCSNKTKAARLLGISRRTLYRKLQRYGLSD